MRADNHGTLYSIVLVLTPTRQATIRATVGHQAHAAFLRTVREADAALAEVLHHPDLPMRPFTVSPLLGVDQARNRRVRVSPEQDYALRFTVLYEPIFQQFMQRFLGEQGRPVIRLGNVVFLIKEILVTPDSHPWAGYTSWSTLVTEAQPWTEITLEFTSPTAFNFGTKQWGKRFFVLPDPEPVFGSLIRTWNSLAPPELALDSKALLAYLAENVVVRRLKNLETRMLCYRKHPQIGFTGRVEYGLMGDGDEEIKCQLNALADLAFYSGVGYHTTMGMGQTRRVVE